MEHLKVDLKQDIKTLQDQNKDGHHKSFYQLEQIEVFSIFFIKLNILKVLGIIWMKKILDIKNLVLM